MNRPFRIDTDSLDSSYQVTLEISALQYFPWLISQAVQAIEKEELKAGIPVLAAPLLHRRD